MIFYDLRFIVLLLLFDPMFWIVIAVPLWITAFLAGRVVRCTWDRYWGVRAAR